MDMLRLVLYSDNSLQLLVYLRLQLCLVHKAFYRLHLFVFPGLTSLCHCCLNSFLGILLLSSVTDLPQLVVWVACCAGAADAYVNSLKTLF